MVKNITKKAIRELVKDLRENPFGWQVYKAYVYIKDDKAVLGGSYVGQGLSEVVYNGTYDAIEEFGSIVRSGFNLKDATETIYEYVSDMIDNYNNDNLEEKK